MSESTWRRGQKHSYTDRPLTDQEKLFAEEKHDFIYTYMRIKHLDIEEWYDILVIPYLNSVKKYFEDEEARQHSFEVVSFMKLETVVMNHYRAMYRKKRMPEGGFISLNLVLQGDNPFSEYTHDEWYIDNTKSTEKSAIALYIIQQIFEQLSYDQARILRVKMDGYTVPEMTEILVIPMAKINREMKEINKVITYSDKKLGKECVCYEDFMQGR